MRLILLRHGIAVDPEKHAANGGVETERPLTERGIKRAKRAVRGLRRLVEHIDLIVASPYKRAVQTAEILCHAFRRSERPRIVTLQALLPGGVPNQTVESLQQHDQKATIALVGHEPDLSRLFTYLTANTSVEIVRFGKTGAALLRCPNGPTAGGCEMAWFLSPSILRRLGV